MTIEDRLEKIERGKAVNKDNYIRLLEKENQEYFEKVIKTTKDCCCHEIPELNGEINELLDDLNDLQADWAADHAECRKTLETTTYQRTLINRFSNEQQGVVVRLRKENEILNGHNSQHREIIRELKKEKYDMGMELAKLKKQLVSKVHDQLLRRATDYTEWVGCLERGEGMNKQSLKTYIELLEQDRYEMNAEIARLQAFMDGIDRQAEELDEKDRTIRDLEEQISKLKAAVAPKSKAPSYVPGYERKGGN